MSFLLDTNVLSEPGKARPNRRLLSWLTQNEPSSYVSVIALGELIDGASRLAQDDPPRAQSLMDWQNEFAGRFDDRVLAVELEVASEWGRLSARLRHEPIAFADALIAATALVHDLTVATRNVRHFERTGVRVVNPFEG